MVTVRKSRADAARSARSIALRVMARGHSGAKGLAIGRGTARLMPTFCVRISPNLTDCVASLPHFSAPAK